MQEEVCLQMLSMFVSWRYLIYSFVKVICFIFKRYFPQGMDVTAFRHRPKSGLERGGTRSRPQTATIDESDENPPDPETLEAVKIKEALQKESTESLTSAPVNTEVMA